MSNTEYHFKTKAYNASCKLNPMKKQVIRAGLMYEANISNRKGWQPLRVTLVMGDQSTRLVLDQGFLMQKSTLILRLSNAENEYTFVG